jgi:fructose-1,6-bisphosphatase
LFNRDYCPIWQRSPIGEVTTIEPNVYVSHEKSEHYYDDRSAPYYNNNGTLEKCMSILKEWGVASKQAKVMELLPEAIAARDMRILSPKGTS